MKNNLTIKSLLPTKVLNSIELNNNKTYIGIDFGTSTTVVSVAIFDSLKNKVTTKAIELNQKFYDGTIYKSYKIPTMIGYYNKKLIVGEGANRLKLKLKQNINLWHSFKMGLGEDIGCKYPQSQLNNDKLRILNPKDATKIFFKYLKTQIEKYVANNNLPPHREYAISIPASFEANQRKDLIDSLNANNIMLEKQALIDEPNSAFLSYVSDSELKKEIVIMQDYPTNILVFDFGAGTCDISILEVGYSPSGFYSKNLSISRFEALGGKDMDRLIAIDILFPQFLKENNLKSNFFKSKDIKNHIIPKLETVAEILKIKISEKLSLFQTNKNLDSFIDDDSGVASNHTVEIKSRKGLFTLSNPKLSYKEFFEINAMFTSMDTEYSEHRINDEEEYKSIYLPIFTALKKAYLEKDDIDYLLFIGGSAKNPLIQNSLKDYFDESEHLIPQNLQAHVSSGASIHSLIFNGFGRNIIEPITSEPIFALIRDGENELIKILLKAGTIIPCETIIINDFQAQKDGQKIIEIPICVGNKDKILHILKVESPSINGFSLNTYIELSLSISADKMLIIKAMVNNQSIKIEPLNPFSNQEASIKDKKKFQAEKEFNNSVASNGGKSTKSDLIKLYNEYENLGLDLKAGETLEELYERFEYGSLNNIGVAYGRAGDEERAMKFYEKAMQKDPSEITAFNIALKYKYKNKKLYKEWLQKSLDIDPNYNISLYLYGVILVDKGEEVKGFKMINRAFDSWKVEYEMGCISSDISWFIACAKYLGKYEYAIELEKSIEEDEIDEGLYSSDNLTSVKLNQLEGF